jgi:phosphatidylglycerol---prolipoprotein diacylglyceryl transferase
LNANNHLVPAPGCNDAGCAPWVRVHPAPVYETILYTVVFLILWSIRKKVHVDGRILYLYLMMAGGARFMVEFIRVNPRVLWGLSEAQLIALTMVIIGVAAYCWSRVTAPADATAAQAA